MQYVHDILFCIHTILIIASIVVLVSSDSLRGKGRLLAFLILAVVSGLGHYIPALFLRWEIVSFDVFREYIQPLYVIFSAAGLAGWVLLRLFVIDLKSIQVSMWSEVLPVAVRPMTIGQALFSFNGRLCRSDYWLKGFLPVMLPLGDRKSVV